MASDQVLFNEDRMRKLRKDIQDIEDHANYLRNTTNGFVNQLDSQLLSQIGSDTAQVQALINKLTSKAEGMSGFLDFTIKKVKETEQANIKDAEALKQAPSTGKSWWERLASSLGAEAKAVVQKIVSGLEHLAKTITHTNPLKLLIAPVPTLLVEVAKEFQVQIQTATIEKQLGSLKQDKTVAQLLDQRTKGTPAEQKWANERLGQIKASYTALGRSQAAYHMYAKFGNQAYMDEAKKEMEAERTKLGQLSIASSFYDENVDVSSLYAGSALLACKYNPTKNDHSGMPQDNELRSLILTSLSKGKEGEWARNQLEAMAAAASHAKNFVQGLVVDTAVSNYKALKNQIAEGWHSTVDFVLHPIANLKRDGQNAVLFLNKFAPEESTVKSYNAFTGPYQMLYDGIKKINPTEVYKQNVETAEQIFFRPIEQQIEEFKNKNPDAQYRVIGHGIGEILLVVFGAKGAGAVAEALRVAQLRELAIVGQKESQVVGEIRQAERSGLEETGDFLNKSADPFYDIYGPGIKSHPEVWNQIIKDIENLGGKVKFREDGSMGYSPGLSKGQPGEIIIDNNASLSALRHEYQHFLDDMKIGWGGMSTLYEFKTRVIWELRAYMKEIREAEKLGYKDVAEQLWENYRRERKKILDDFGPLP